MTREYVKIYMFSTVFWYIFIYSASLLLTLLFYTNPHTHTDTYLKERREREKAI